ncbi:MAG TPA: HlyD family secretion protein [Bacteroidales bacterium]|nr:HlyD family secretion protein [Bacteroidales bacterium]
MKQDSKKNKFKVYIPLGIIIVIILAGALYWYNDYRMYITTDDAHVDADNVTVSSKIMGRLIALHAAEGDSVKEGQLLVEIDSTDLLAQKKQVLAVKSQAGAGLSQAQVKYASDQKSIRVLEINLDRAKEDLDRAKNQVAGGVITQEQFDHSKKTFESAQAQLDASKAQLSVSAAMITSAAAAVETAGAQVKVLDTQIRNAKLYAPVNGVVAKRWLLPGDIIQPGQSAFTLTDKSTLWVVAFLEETKIFEIHPGQDVRFTLDAFPHVRFFGKVFYSGSSTASVFSLIPANNASGNFTKVTQRIPVKISIDRTSDGKGVSGYRILSGMSAVVKIVR